jgi:hypothetical protein
VPWRSKFTGKQAAIAVQPHESSRHEPTPKVEMILMVNFTSTQARAKEVAPPTSSEGGQAEAAIAKPPSALAPLPADGVDKMYRQLAEIHAIATTQLAEYAHWHQFDSTPSPVRARASRRRPIMTLSMIRLAPSPPIDFLSHAL